ncbi:hypothetical protein [Treponema zioleckii]|uniref:hypothetical protein n=1 Tax=Treponema zioleckii TaxID=331680 RepID=UPI00168A7480|nr:hypothetical protein [Treponema zioleckii]
MCINDKDPKKSLMLDASGSYGGARPADILDGMQAPISINAYLNYWNTDEKLTTFELKLPEKEKNIRTAIGQIDGRSWMSCATLASKVLNENYSAEIKNCSTPKGLLDSLNKYVKKHPNEVTVKHYDFRTKQEVVQNEEK